jgi:hypothetical protein
MTDRDEFAKAALVGFTSSIEDGMPYDLDLLVKQVYEIADAMLRQRGQCQVLSQENLTLTDAEREAIAMSATVADVACEEATRCGVDDDSWRLAADMNAARAATLRGLLERLGGGE